MLRIPSENDRPPPLMMPLKSSKMDENHAESLHQESHIRKRRKRSKRGENPAWESGEGEEHHSPREEKHQMMWMLIGGATLLVLILVGVLMAQKSGGKTSASPPPAVTRKPVDAPRVGSTVVGVSKPEVMSDSEFLAAAEPLAKKFLEATRVEDLLPLIRNSKLAESRMKASLPDGKVTALGMSAFNPYFDITRTGTVMSVIVRTGDFEEKPMSFHATAEGLKIDWECWTGWSEMPWEEFVAGKPTQAKLFRVNVSKVEYYNMAFTDDKKWMSYRLESPDKKRTLYGYAEQGTPLNSQLRTDDDSKGVGMILALRFPEHATSPNQVLIDHVINVGWAIEKEESP